MGVFQDKLAEILVERSFRRKFFFVKGWHYVLGCFLFGAVALFTLNLHRWFAGFACAVFLGFVWFDLKDHDKAKDAWVAERMAEVKAGKFKGVR